MCKRNYCPEAGEDRYSYQDAAEALRQVQEENRQYLDTPRHIWWCPTCQAWHVTTSAATKGAGVYATDPQRGIVVAHIDVSDSEEELLRIAKEATRQRDEFAIGIESTKSIGFNIKLMKPYLLVDLLRSDRIWKDIPEFQEEEFRSFMVKRLAGIVENTFTSVEKDLQVLKKSSQGPAKGALIRKIDGNIKEHMFVFKVFPEKLIEINDQIQKCKDW